MSKILMIAAEATGFASAGGLGDVVAALPGALAAAGEQVTVLMPLYRHVQRTRLNPVYEGLRVRVGSRLYAARVFEWFRDGVRWLFLDIPDLYDRAGIYEENGYQCPDNHVRFAVLCEAALVISCHLFLPDVMHCHDWHAALTPVLLRERRWLHPALSGVKTVLTIHNLGYQGRFARGAAADLGLRHSLFNAGVIAHSGWLNFLKAGVVLSDAITTVSPRYAQEIQTPALGFGLDEVLRSRTAQLTGILNGADDSWHPATDPGIAARFDSHDLRGKQECKRSLAAEFGWPEAVLTKPFVGAVSRLVEQKGFDLLMRIPHEFVQAGFMLIALGSGEQRFEDFFRWFAAAYPNCVGVRIGYDTALARRIIAGADMFLMPSHYEPCGLNQMYAMRYGTLPVVRATGGLDDTVDARTGFKFIADDPKALLECLRIARATYGTPRWSEMIEDAMRRDFSWARSANEYIRVYHDLAEMQRRGGSLPS